MVGDSRACQVLQHGFRPASNRPLGAPPDQGPGNLPASVAETRSTATRAELGSRMSVSSRSNSTALGFLIISEEQRVASCSNLCVTESAFENARPGLQTREHHPGQEGSGLHRLSVVPV